MAYQFCFSGKCWLIHLWDSKIFFPTRNVIKFIIVILFLPPGMLSSLSDCVSSPTWVWDSRNLSGTPGLLLNSVGSCVGRAPTELQSPYLSSGSWGAGCVMITPLLRGSWEGQMRWCVKSSATEHELDKSMADSCQYMTKTTTIL